MNRPRQINYALRPAKNIERKMMGEALVRLNVIAPLSRYRYVGFGSEFFNDFALYHQTLGIDDMVSIEGDEAKIARCNFNRPYKCIEVREGTSHVVLPQLEWKKRCIVWLDYTGALNREVLEDVRYLTSVLPSGSALFISVNVNPLGDDDDNAQHGKATDLARRRYSKLVERVGKAKVPSGVTGVSLAKWGLSNACHTILRAHIDTTIHDVNAAVDTPKKRRYRQCFHFQYQDGAMMLTVGGVIVDQKDDERLGLKPFDGLWFVRDGDEPLLINPPILTGREARYLNSLLPHMEDELKEPPWLMADERARYRKIYRYFPIFAESEL